MKNKIHIRRKQFHTWSYIIFGVVTFIIYAFAQAWMFSKNIFANFLALLATGLVATFVIYNYKDKNISYNKFFAKFRCKGWPYKILASILGVCLILLGLGIYLLVIMKLGMTPGDNNNQDLLVKLASDNKIRFFLETVIMGPIFEESIFRYAMISFKNNKWLLFTSLISVIIFAAAHVAGSPHYLLIFCNYLMPSIGFTLVYDYTEDIRSSMLTHMLYNLVAFSAIM